jgi:hypothetical protein
LHRRWPGGLVRSTLNYQGLARLFRARVIAANAEYSKAAAVIARPLVRRGQRTPIPRQGALIDAHRLWSRLPSFGLLDRALELEKRSLRIHELRLSASDFRAECWSAGVLEPGISVVGIVLDIRPRVFGFDVLSLCSISRHALGRWFQRAVDTSEAALWDDLRTLAKAHAALAAGDATTFEVRTKSGAHWLGDMLDCEDPRHAPGGVDRVRAVRTFM